MVICLIDTVDKYKKILFVIFSTLYLVGIFLIIQIDVFSPAHMLFIAIPSVLFAFLYTLAGLIIGFVSILIVFPTIADKYMIVVTANPFFLLSISIALNCSIAYIIGSFKDLLIKKVVSIILRKFFMPQSEEFTYETCSS
ncbi:hypothetical protein B4O97_17605 [Marispirochaeta aestuarii]|uniref:Uncharacterized protein n=1 Tax=Marispirochaeta aestuarii TaxID=1963862 RepID=A0A1Y1RUJ3_9SPIO|nr:hypothetical protein B4O97_17605 [Marispirochaeta aestuarii]